MRLAPKRAQTVSQADPGGLIHGFNAADQTGTGPQAVCSGDQIWPCLRRDPAPLTFFQQRIRWHKIGIGGVFGVFRDCGVQLWKIGASRQKG